METWCPHCEEVRLFPHDCPHECGERYLPELVKVNEKRATGFGWKWWATWVPVWVVMLLVGWNTKPLLWKLFDWWHGR
jgi:hypothetical protein